ncbi:SCAN domain-containing protein 3, partial [Stegodyphus mimosarum]
MDESTLKDSEAVLITYVRYIDTGHFDEEMLFCKRLESTTTSKDIYNKLKNYLDVNNIPMKNITSCAADSALNMMGKKNDCLKLMKDENPEMVLVHCVIHRENLVANNILPVLNEVLHSVVSMLLKLMPNFSLSLATFGDFLPNVETKIGLRNHRQLGDILPT